MEIEIRPAVIEDCDGILRLLAQVGEIHRKGRPDIFRENGVKFTAGEVAELVRDDAHVIFVAEGQGKILGYAFCNIVIISESTLLKDAMVLHIEDVCVDENYRGNKIGSRLMTAVKRYARSLGCTRIDLDVWEFNDKAREFYEKQGFSVQKRRMNIVL